MTLTSSQETHLLALARDTLAIEAQAISQMQNRLGAQFLGALQALLTVRGRVVVMGMGKSGHIGRKIAATLASTGTPAFFVHPAEASHGDLGMVTADDLVIALSNSGESDELSALLPVISAKVLCWWPSRAAALQPWPNTPPGCWTAAWKKRPAL